MDYNKIIILDLDGVIATEECWQKTEKKFGKNIYRWNDNCVKVLNEILNETDADIILSSDWRKHFDLKTLDEIFKWNNVVKSPVDVTDEIKRSFSSDIEEDRIQQIGRFLEKNQINFWVCVDDLDLNSDIVPNFVQVDQELGISQEGIKEKLLSYLNKSN
jgi:hypothetical protein